MSIEADQVTIDSLEKYRNLMKGKVAKSVSNASYQSAGGLVEDYPLNSIHTWRNDSRSTKGIVGAFEMKFDKPTSLVSLNMDITFECGDSRRLVESLL